MIIVGLLVAAGGTVWLGFTDTVLLFLTASAIAGIGSGLLTPAQQATVADVIGSKGRGGPVLAAFQMAADIGAVIGPIVAGILADQLSYAAAFAMTGVLAALAALVWLPAPETLPGRTGKGRHPTPEEALATEVSPAASPPPAPGSPPRSR